MREPVDADRGPSRRRFLRRTAILGTGAALTPRASTARSPALAQETPPRSLRVAGAQMPVTRDVGKNLATILRALDFAAGEKADLLVTPEGALSGYFAGFDARATAEATKEVVDHARRAGVALVLGTCFEDESGARYDAQRFFARDGSDLGFHAKILLCRDMAHPEKKGEVDSFRTAPLRTFTLDGLTVAGLVCNDLWANPEWTPMDDPYLARQAAAMGARAIFHSIHSGQAEGPELELIRGFHESNLRLRARHAGVWIVAVNACDPEGKREVNCRSGVVAPDGRWLAQANPLGEQFFAHTIDLGSSGRAAAH